MAFEKQNSEKQKQNWDRIRKNRNRIGTEFETDFQMRQNLRQNSTKLLLKPHLKVLLHVQVIFILRNYLISIV